MKDKEIPQTYYDIIIQRHQKIMTGVSCKQLQALVEEILAVKIQSDEHIAHTVVSTDVEQMGRGYMKEEPYIPLNAIRGYNSDVDTWIAGYNAAIQSQSIQPMNKDSQ